MPTYVYKCSACEKTQEIKQKITDSALTQCPICHKEALKRIPSRDVTIQFKGSGFYINDYNKSEPSGPSPSCGHGACGSCKS